MGKLGKFLGNVANSLAGGASGIVSGALGGISQIITNRQNIKAQKEAQDREYQYQRQLNQQSQDFNVQNMELENKYAMENWLTQQEYNSPENQLKRIQETGINPNLVMGESGVTNAANTSPDTPSAQTPSGGDVSSYSPNIQNAFTSAVNAIGTSLQYDALNQDIRNKRASENLTNAQVQQTLQDTLKKQQETLSYLLDNQKKQFENSKLEEIWNWRIKETELSIKQTEEAIKNLQKESNLHDANADYVRERQRLTKEEVNKMIADTKYVEVQTKLEEWALAFRDKHNRLPSDDVAMTEVAGMIEAVFGTYKDRLGNHNGKGLLKNLWLAAKEAIQEK